MPASKPSCSPSSDLAAADSIGEASLRRDLRSLARYIREYRVELGVITVACTAILVQPLFYYEWGDWQSSLVFFGALPLVSALLLGIPLRELGLGLGSVRAWWPLTACAVAISIPLLALGAQLSQVDRYYANQGFDPVASLLSVTLYMTGWEFLSRGFLLFGLRKRFGEAAILIQILPFTIAHLGKPTVEALSCVLSGLLWGYICYRGNSFWPAVLLHVVAKYGGQVFMKLS